jgi:hypothetical protein
VLALKHAAKMPRSSIMVTKHTLFRPTRTETKAGATTSAAQSIIAGEAAARKAKIARLRKARLEREASAGPAEAAKPTRKRPAGRAKP